MVLKGTRLLKIWCSRYSSIRILLAMEAGSRYNRAVYSIGELRKATSRETTRQNRLTPFHLCFIQKHFKQ